MRAADAKAASRLSWYAVLGCLIFHSGTAFGQMPLDLTFGGGGIGDSTWPWGWNIWDLVQKGYQVQLDHDIRGHSGPTLRVDGMGVGAVATALYRINSTFANGKRLSFTARVRASSDGGVPTKLTLYARSIVEGQFVIVAADSAPESRPDDQADWDRLSVEIHVPDDVDMIDVGLVFGGERVVWVADLEMFVDDQPAQTSGGISGPTSKLVDATQQHSIPLATADPSAPVDDLAPVLSMVGDAHYVLLGESTHGTREFFTLKHRLIRAFVERNESVVIALEDHQTAVSRLQDLVAGVSAEVAADAMSDLFAVWSRDEMKTLVEWARETTRSGSGHVVFAGVDMQDPRPGMQRVVALLEPEYPDLAISVDSAYDHVRAAWGDPRRLGDAVAVDELEAVAQRVIQRLDALDANSSNLTHLAEARRIAAIVPQAIELAHTRDQSVRDRHMAANLRTLGEQYAQSRIVFWGHNGHTRLSPGGMGGYLETDLPDAVVAFGLLTYEGTFRGIWPRDGGWSAGDFPIYTAPPASIEALLHRTGHPFLALDLRSDWARSSLGEVKEMRSIGALPEDYGFGPTTLIGTFHVLLFVDRSGAATALRP